MNFFSSFFRKHKPGLSSLSFDTLGWPEKERTKTMISWQSPEHPALLSVNFFSEKPDLPGDAESEALRSFYREVISGQKGGLIRVEFVSIDNLPAVETIFKIPLEASEYFYIGSFTLPFEDCSYVVKIQARDWGDTRFRSQSIADRLTTSGKLKADDYGNYLNWAYDPYDPTLSEGTLMNIAEQEIYDLFFPDHPLTLVRTYMNRIRPAFSLNHLLKSKAPFYVF